HFTMPIKGPLLAIVEVRDATIGGAQQKMEALLSAEMENGTVTDGIIAQSHAQARSLWAMRDEGPATYSQVFTDNIGFDVSVPLSRMVEAVHKIAAPLRIRPGLHPMFYGHIGDQNLHVVVGTDETFTEAQSGAIKDDLYRTVVSLGGTISAEHGIGTLKKSYLSMSRSPVALALMRDLKRTLDPKNILNPGRVFDL
ncbi:MAG: FAD-linked oxidase C-terminal domain-containing protein, partial [Pseudomonadota bacterium]